MSSHTKGRSSRQQLTSAKQIAENEDLLIEILKRLPALALVSYRRVCKHWRTLISSSEFRQTWISTRREFKPIGFLFCEQGYQNRSKFLYLNDKIPAIIESSYSDFPFHKVDVIQSCNGLILCAYSSFEPLRDCFVCNATTKQVVKLSTPCQGTVFGSSLSLAFDPRISPYYKVLCLEFLQRAVYVYSSEFRVWRVYEATFYTYEMRLSNQAYCKGVMYWMPCSSKNGLCFDIEKEKLGTFKLPRTSEEDNGYIGRSRFCFMGVCGDRLYLVESYFGHFLHYVVHEKEQDGFGWVLKHRVNFYQEVATRLTAAPQEPNFLCIQQDENGELGMVFSMSGETVAYYFRSMSVKKFPLFPSHRCVKCFEHFDTFYSV